MERWDHSQLKIICSVTVKEREKNPAVSAGDAEIGMHIAIVPS